VAFEECVNYQVIQGVYMLTHRKRLIRKEMWERGREVGREEKRMKGKGAISVLPCYFRVC